MSIESLFTIFALTLSAIGTFLAVSKFYQEKIKEIVSERTKAQEKEFAAEKEFRHLKRNYEQLQSSIDLLTKELEVRVEKLEVKIDRIKTILVVEKEPIAKILEDDDR